VEFNAQQTKAQNLADKINKISAKFDVAEEICSEDVAEFVETKTQEVVLHKEEYHPVDVMTLEIMADDFKHSREVLKETIDNGRRVLSVATLNLLDADEESTASMTMAFAELTSAVHNGIKTQSTLYKDFSTVLLNIKKLNKDTELKNVTNNVTINTNEVISTTELIAKLKGK
jgi:hypothetical protein